MSVAASPDDTGSATIYALSSGRPPAAIGVVRISGPRADAALFALAGRLPPPRHASLATLRDVRGEPLDRAIALRFPGPASATGEDLVELHLHGGRAVIAAVSGALAAIGLREAEPGEFTRRALFSGRVDPSEVEGLADLLAAETEAQRRDAMRRVDGALGRLATTWHRRMLDIQATIEVAIDHDDDDVGTGAIIAEIAICVAELGEVLAMPPVERLRDGIRVVLSGPVNSGKSSLFNALLDAEAAIVSPIAGTTRDAIERPVSFGGLPFVLVDTAGLRETADPIEAEGVARARDALERADIILDLGTTSATNGVRGIAVSARCDLAPPRAGTIATSSITGEGLSDLIATIIQAAESIVPGPDEVSLDRRHRDALTMARDALTASLVEDDLLLIAERVREAAGATGGLAGHKAVEALLDALFSRFCLGK